jgi:LAO/AO transport system kinase
MTAMSAPTARLSPEHPDWIGRLRGGDRIALARAITQIENEAPGAQAVLRAIFPHVGQAQVVGFTGAPGVGKSTLVSAYVSELRRRGRTVGVIAVDPSSPLSGGAILGDRIRMAEHGADPGVFVRSLAARGHLGGLTRMTARVVDVMDAAGREVVVLETVGAGQSEVEIAGIAQTKVVVSAPGLGDEIQAVKAGVLEIADVLVVNKADNPLVEQTVRQLRDALKLSHRAGWQVPVLRTVATTGEGLPELADAIAGHLAQLDPAARAAAPRQRMRRLIAAAAARQARRRVEGLQGPAFDALCDAVLKGELDFEVAARQALAPDFEEGP